MSSPSFATEKPNILQHEKNGVHGGRRDLTKMGKQLIKKEKEGKL